MDINKLKEIRRLAIIALFSDDDLMDVFVLKGGNAISLVYELDYRASQDIDVSMADDFDEGELQDFDYYFDYMAGLVESLKSALERKASSDH